MTTRLRRLVLPALVLASGGLLATLPLAQTDPLPSWNDGAAKKAIVESEANVTKEDGLPAGNSDGDLQILP